ncbi:hypothetical protein TNCV_4019781 [Trichonephila clavipes]|nr:hypothetical protein TNCV_4019781 [Trichonephila clavipes]
MQIAQDIDSLNYNQTLRKVSWKAQRKNLYSSEQQRDKDFQDEIKMLKKIWNKFLWKDTESKLHHILRMKNCSKSWISNSLQEQIENLKLDLEAASENESKSGVAIYRSLEEFRRANSYCHLTASAGWDVVQSGRPIFNDFFQHLWPYIGNNTANVVFQMVKRLWLIRIDQ